MRRLMRKPSRPRSPRASAIAALSFLSLIGVGRARADDTLSLNKVVERAVSGNPDLRRERINVDTQAAQIESALGFFDVNLTGDFTFSQSTRPSLGAQDIQAGTNNSLNFDFDIRRNLETGGKFDLGFSGSRSTTNQALICGTLSMSTVNCNVYGTTLSLNFTQPLLRGFGPSFALANVHKQTIERDQALLNRQMRASNVLRDVINTYWGLAYATQFLAIQTSAVDLAREQLRVTKAQIDVGRSAPVDAAAVERAISDRLQAVVQAQQDLNFRGLDLKRLLGAPVNPGDAVIVAADAPQASGPEKIDVVGEISRAVASNPQLKSLKLGMKLTDIDIQTALSALRPQLDFVGSVGSTGRKRDLNDSLSQMVDFEARTWSAGLQFGLPVQNRIAGGQERVARLAGEKALLEAGDFEIELRYQAQKLATQIQSAAQRVELAKQTVGFANQALEAEKARFSVGRSTNNEVLRVQQDLKNAEIQVVSATVDLLVAQTTLRALTGDLLEHYRLTLKGIEGPTER